MLFRIIERESLRRMVELLLDTNEVIGPKLVKVRKDGKHLYQFLPVPQFDDIRWDYDQTAYSAKTYFLPYREKLSEFCFRGDDWTQEVHYRVEPRALVGLHACDINALLKLDKVFTHGTFPSPYYLARRRNTFIVGIDHEPCEKGFCASLGEDSVTRGFDLFLTDLGDRYFVAIGSDRGFGLIGRVGSREVQEDDTHAYLGTRRRQSAAYKTTVNVKNLPNLLDLEFDSPVWKKWGEKCLSCGACAMVCPTCYCYGVHERVSMDFSEGSKVKQLHSCNLVDFAMVAGPHNFRPTRESRLKYRYYHQHRGFAEAYDEPKCVGCNRCGDVCLAGINPPDVIRDLASEQHP